MSVREYQLAACKPSRLYDELIAAVPRLQWVQADGTRVTELQMAYKSPRLGLGLPDDLTAAEGTTIDGVVAAHDGTTPTSEEVQGAEDDQNLQEWHAQAKQMVARDDQIIQQMNANPTPAQVAAGVRDLAQAQKRIVKMVDRLARLLH